MPYQMREIIRDRGEDVVGTPPNIGRALAAIAHRISQEARRHELALSHGTRPGADHRRGLDLVLLDDEQRVDQLAAKKRAAPSVKGERRERRDNRILTDARAEIGLD